MAIVVLRDCGFVARNSTSNIHAAIVEIGGRRCLDLRQFVIQPDGEEVPTRSGICATVDLLPELVKLLEAMASAAAELAEAGGDGEGGASGRKGKE